jgi:hypothetical protein
LLESVPRDRYEIFADQVCAGLLEPLKVHSSFIMNDDHARWQKVLSLLSSAALIPSAVRSSYEVTNILVLEERLTKENYEECVDLLLSYPSSSASLVAGGVLQSNMPKNLGSPSKNVELNAQYLFCETHY